MRRIIEGLSYDTETAELLGEASAPLYSTDFGHWSEGLYRTKTGRFFLAGEGNARSSWAERFGNSTGPGRGIRTYTEEEAKAWAERYLNADKYEAAFGQTEEA